MSLLCRVGRSPFSSNFRQSIRMSSSTRNQEEVDKFAAMATDWWNPDGVCKPLHSMNRLRIPFIRDRLVPSVTSAIPLEGLDILDIGCGGGIVTEQLARLGANVTGLDAARESIEIAKLHSSRDPGIAENVKYLCTTVEEFQASNSEVKFDAIVASEVIEHVDNPELFIKTISSLLKDGGSLFLTTLSRSTRSWLLGILAAEYVLRLLPPGTHDWNKFITPAEVEELLDKAGMGTRAVQGMLYIPGLNKWTWFPDTSVNYALHAKKYL